jgi:uncharacterized protein
MAITAIDLPMKPIAEFCDRWQVTEFALFGSVLRDDFRPDSDIDVMVQFHPEACETDWSMNNDAIDLNIVWDAVQTAIPNLIEVLKL